jgi:hypothetical protein
VSRRGRHERETIRTSGQTMAWQARRSIRLARRRAWAGPTPAQHDDYAERRTLDLAIVETVYTGEGEAS